MRDPPRYNFRLEDLRAWHLIEAFPIRGFRSRARAAVPALRRPRTCVACHPGGASGLRDC